MAAEFIGIEAINNNLENFSFDALGVFDKKLEKFKKIKTEGEREEDLISSFNSWVDRMLASNPNNNKTYSIQLYELPEGSSRIKGTSSFTFSLSSSLPNYDKPKNAISGEHITKRELDLALENQRLEFEKHLLEQEIQNFDDEPEQAGILGTLNDTIKDQMPQLINMFIGMLAGKAANNNFTTGIGSNIDEVIAEFKLINPDIESDLHKLLQIAKTKPDLFKLLISQLRSM